MVRYITKPEDVGDERQQAFFMATVRALHNGDVQAAIDNYNKQMKKLEELDKQASVSNEKTSHVQLRFAHQ